MGSAPKPFSSVSVVEYKRIIGKEPTEAQKGYLDALSETAKLKDNGTSIYNDIIKAADYAPPERKETEKVVIARAEENSFEYKDAFEEKVIVKTEEPVRLAKPEGAEEISIAPEIDIEFKYIGEAYKTYIIVEFKGSIYFIDKHAAHERILFEKLKRSEKLECQQLLLPLTIKLPADQYNAILDSFELLEKSGFEIEDFGNNTVIVRGIPSSLSGEDVSDVIYELAENLSVSGKVEIERLEDIYHTVACKAAIKAGWKTIS